MSKLTPKQQKFVEEYLIDLNATQAAIRAGYHPKMAAKLVAKGSIQEAISVRRKEISETLEITQERVIAEYAKIAFANMGDYMKPNRDGDPVLDFKDLSRDNTAALSEVTVDDFVDGRGEDSREVRRVKFKLHDKIAALKDLGKHLGLFEEGVKIQPEITIKVERSEEPDWDIS